MQQNINNKKFKKQSNWRKLSTLFFAVMFILCLIQLYLIGQTEGVWNNFIFCIVLALGIAANILSLREAKKNYARS